MNITIRAVKNDDYQDLHEVYTCPGVMRNTLGLPSVSLDFWKERTEDRSPNRHVLVAEVDGRVVGSITDNEPGIALYKKFGFEIEGTHRNHAFREGNYVDSYTMARLRL